MVITSDSRKKTKVQQRNVEDKHPKCKVQQASERRLSYFEEEGYGEIDFNVEITSKQRN